MSKYQKIKKCLKSGCDGTALVGSNYCMEHQVKQLQNNNPQGYNRFKANPAPSPEVLSKEQAFMVLSKPEQYDEIKALGNKIWVEGTELRKLRSRFTMMNKAYFGFDFQEE